MPVKQEAVLFGDGHSLSGVITYPDKPLHGAPAVVFLTAGVVHRVGPNCLYVRLCREMAAHGFLTLRFDLSGIGDSLPRVDHMVFSQSSLLESQAAMDFLTATTGVRRFVMAGLCSGAFAAVKAASYDPRVQGAIVINAQTLQDGDQNEFQAYAFNRSVIRHLMNPRTWLKVFAGTARFEGKLEILAAQLTGVFRRRRLAQSARSVVQQLHTLTERNVNLLFIYSKGDPGLEYFRLLGEHEIKRLRENGRLQLKIISGTDHIFAPPEAVEKVRRVCVHWLERSYGSTDEALVVNGSKVSVSHAPGRGETPPEAGLNLSLERSQPTARPV
jgi:pimeloyl-ACP methyl ester carboxylesterase